MKRILGTGVLAGSRKCLGLWLLLPLLAVPLSCSKSDPSRASIHGMVSVGGKPIEQGRIVFKPTRGNSGPSAGATIENGSYTIAAERGPKIGANQVQISGLEKTGKKIQSPAFPGGPKIDQLREIVPERYRGEESVLEYVVVPGDQEKNFDLEAKLESPALGLTDRRWQGDGYGVIVLGATVESRSLKRCQRMIATLAVSRGALGVIHAGETCRRPGPPPPLRSATVVLAATRGQGVDRMLPQQAVQYARHTTLHPSAASGRNQKTPFASLAATRCEKTFYGDAAIIFVKELTMFEVSSTRSPL